MTKKRFTIKEFSTLNAMSSLDVICDKGIELPSSTACDLLNELHEENEQLKDALNQRTDQCDKLYEENKELKEKIDIMADAFAQSNDLIEVEQVFYTKVCEPSEHYDEETLSEITNVLLGSDVEITEKRFTECEYYQHSDNIWSLGYCINPIRHKKINGVALLYCQGSACEFDTKKKWW